MKLLELTTPNDESVSTRRRISFSSPFHFHRFSLRSLPLLLSFLPSYPVLAPWDAQTSSSLVSGISWLPPFGVLIYSHCMLEYHWSSLNNTKTPQRLSSATTALRSGFAWDSPDPVPCPQARVSRVVVSRWTVSQDGCHAPEATLKKLKAWEVSVLPSVILDVLSGF